MLEQLKTLNKTCTALFETLYRKAQTEDDYFHIDKEDESDPNEPFSFEIREGIMVENQRARVVVMSQTWICNGDLMSDPTMRFLYIPETHKIYPLDYQLDGVYPDGTIYDVVMQINRNEITRLNSQMERELIELTENWLRNLYLQFFEIYALAPELKDSVLKELD